MMLQLRNHMALAAQLAQAGRADSRVGTVTSYDPGTASARVRLEPVDPDNPDRSLTGWLPVTSPWVGNGWGMDAPVSPGDQVEVQFFGGEIENGYICARLFSDQQRPTGAQSGEFFLTHQSGSYVKLTNDGKLLINSQVEIDASGPTINIQATGNVNVQAGGYANITAPSIQLGASGQSLLAFVTSAFMSLFNSHTHPEHDGGNTSAPNQQMGASHVTTTVKGG
ncbi:phage baseplate assembly protein V [Ralstonia solanacearum]|uniref:phage baseplate assembly protein V n=1 Tax=Ralstonia solanacearum TaxID=305 RepID=UPI00217514FA|nr:phage baseplate assembly protein V [Ralstonia solanacearum]